MLRALRAPGPAGHRAGSCELFIDIFDVNQILNNANWHFTVRVTLSIYGSSVLHGV